MSMNQLAQNPSQAWIWQTAMDSRHPYYHQVVELEQEQDCGNNKERMFEKPLTPSDVGKLNRLVIPKQHAEKYFPLDSESGEKGLLLSFEDECGKSWKFRYSYWTSSQSYVLTKGWSRYVKEKKLDAGDVVLFERCDDRLFIGCRRRVPSNETTITTATAAAAAGEARPNAALPWSPAFYPASTDYYYMNSVNSGGEQASSATSPLESPVASTGSGNSKRLRLFGVNLECGPDPQETQYLQASDSWN